MIKQQYAGERDNDRAHIRFLRLTVGGLVLICIFLALLAFKLVGSEKTVMVPPEIHKSFWVNEDNMSPDYMDEMASFFAGLELNVTPSNVDYNNSVLLRYADPAVYGQLESDGKVAAEKIKRDSLATRLFIQQIHSDAANRQAAVCGVLDTTVSDKSGGSRQSCWVVGFAYSNGRIYVKHFRETTLQNPFGIKANPA